MKTIYLIAVLAFTGCVRERDDDTTALLEAHTKWLKAHDSHLSALEREIESQQKLLEAQQEVITSNARATALGMEYLRLRQNP